MKRVVVLGVKGMAGHIMAEYLAGLGGYVVLGVAREAGPFTNAVIDVTDFSMLASYIEDVKPDVVVNCIGTLVASSRDNLANAILVNSFLPNFLVEVSNTVGFKLIHISTDCVFSGKSGQYLEDSFRDGDDNYARTKALGEIVDDVHLTIRTSIIGPELKQNGTGLLDWFLKQNGSIQGYTKAFWSGVTTLELAKATDQFIFQNIAGLYHLCPVHKISKYELLNKFSRVREKFNRISAVDNYAVDKSLVCTRHDFDYRDLDYDKMLIET